TKIKLRGGKVSVDDIARLEGIADPNAPIDGLPTDNGGQIDIIDPTEEDPYSPPTTVPTNPRPTPTPPSTTPPRPQPGPVVNPNPPVTTTPNPPVVRPPATVPPSNPNVPAAQYHSVVKGETLYAISRKYGLTVPQLQQLNGLRGTTISVGQQLRVK
ncbi:MAG: LysM peptidoglycan-binding domain-containing protein, partial [Bacteroidota bacterium]